VWVEFCLPGANLMVAVDDGGLTLIPKNEGCSKLSVCKCNQGCLRGCDGGESRSLDDQRDGSGSRYSKNGFGLEACLILCSGRGVAFIVE
jgi:hypothetical protein